MVEFLIPFFIWLLVLALLGFRKIIKEDTEALKTINDAHIQNIYATVLHVNDIPKAVVDLSEEDMGIQFSEQPFFDCYKSCN